MICRSRSSASTRRTTSSRPTSILEGKKKVVAELKKAAARRRRDLHRDRPRPRGGGDRLAPGRDPRRKTKASASGSSACSSTRSPRTASGRRWRAPAADRQAPRRRAAGAARSSTASSATSSRPCSGTRSGAASPPGGSSRSPSRWSATARTRSRRSSPRSTGRSPADFGAKLPPEFVAKLAKVDGKKARDPERGDGPRRSRPSSRRAPTGSPQSRRKEKKQPPPPPFTTSKLQQAAAASSPLPGQADDADRPGALRRARSSAIDGHGRSHHLHAYRLGPRLGRGARRGPRLSSARSYGAEYLPEKPNRLQLEEGAQDAHEAIRPTYVELDPREGRDVPDPGRAQPLQAIWERFVAVADDAGALRRDRRRRSRTAAASSAPSARC